MTDDFLFDPWSSTDEAAEEQPSSEPTLAGLDAEAQSPGLPPTPDVQRRSPSTGSHATLKNAGPNPEWRIFPASTDVPSDRSGGSRWRARAVPTPLPAERRAPGARPGDDTRTVSTPGSGPAPAEGPREPVSTVDRLRAIALPLLEAVAFRLHIARHHTLLDDRLDSPSGTIRFRLVPRPAPFDEPAAVPGAVLELMAVDTDIGARLWLDPVAEEPAEEFEVAANRLTEEWLDDIVVDFVARTLRQG